MTERNWVYFANENSKVWGYPVGVLDFFLGDRDPGIHFWTLSQTRYDFHDGDLIWVRAVEPLGAFVGVGRVVSEPEPDTWQGVCLRRSVVRRHLSPDGK